MAGARLSAEAKKAAEELIKAKCIADNLTEKFKSSAKLPDAKELSAPNDLLKTVANKVDNEIYAAHKNLYVNYTLIEMVKAVQKLPKLINQKINDIGLLNTESRWDPLHEIIASCEKIISATKLLVAMDLGIADQLKSKPQ